METTQRYKVTISYDGTNYYGWQSQINARTVEHVLLTTFAKVFGQQPTFFLGASRTDAGVHAHGQVVMLDTTVPSPVHKMVQAWNAQLPDDIVICSIEPVSDVFHSHRGIIHKTYHYHIFMQYPSPFVQRYGWYYRFPLDINKLADTLQVFVGTHDFRSFCTVDDDVDTVRTINHISVEWSDQLNAHRIAITGPKFLRYMIRRIVGASVEVASRPHLDKTYLQQILLEKDRKQRLYKAPAKGLTLHEILYVE